MSHCAKVVKQITNLARITHSLDLISTRMANKVNAILKPLERKKERKKQKVNKKTQSTQTDQKEDIEAKDESTMYDVIYTMEKATVTEKDSEDKATQTEEEAKPSQEENKAKKKIKKTIEWVRL